MRSIKVAFAALALSAATTAFASAAGQDQAVTLTNSIVDTIAVSGTTVVSITAVGTATAPTSGTGPKLAYSTNADHSANTYVNKTRKVTVSSTALPDNLTGTVAFAPTSGSGTTANAVALGTVVDLVTAIPEYITQAPKALDYSFTASKGFVSGAITVTYTLADE